MNLLLAQMMNYRPSTFVVLVLATCLHFSDPPVNTKSFTGFMEWEFIGFTSLFLALILILNRFVRASIIFMTPKLQSSRKKHKIMTLDKKMIIVLILLAHSTQIPFRRSKASSSECNSFDAAVLYVCEKRSHPIKSRKLLRQIIRRIQHQVNGYILSGFKNKFRSEQKCVHRNFFWRWDWWL